MDSMRWDGEADEQHQVIELPNGDIWLGAAEVPGGRRFRCHLGHVVEVFDSGRLRRVGAGLHHARPWLLVDGPLESVIERALHDAGGEATRWQEPADAPPVRMPSPGLLGRLAALLYRGSAAAAGEPAAHASPWRDTMPWTHPR